MVLIQLTGLSGAGKSTLANALSDHLTKMGIRVNILDGDNYRKTWNKDLGYSRKDRIENIQRIGKFAFETRALFDLQILSIINPYEEGRRFLEEKYKAKLVWVDCELQTLLERDPKSLYQRALLPIGHPDKISNLTGINDPFEIPQKFNFYLNTSSESVEKSVSQLIDFCLSLLHFEDFQVLHKP